jgi:hypothetical protein
MGKLEDERKEGMGIRGGERGSRVTGSGREEIDKGGKVE